MIVSPPISNCSTPEGPIFEYACHDGNYGLPNILAAARAKEK